MRAVNGATRPAEHGVHPEWIVPPWPVAGVRAFVTTRAGGVSTAPFDSLNLSSRVGDSEAAVLANRARVRRALPSEAHWLRQEHGITVHRVETLAQQPSCGITPWETLPVADASVTTLRGAVLTVSIADCMPVLFCDLAGTTVGAAHAGWRGLCSGVLEATVAQMQVPADQLCAWLGPCIGPEAFEVGEEVRAAFCAVAPDAREHFTPRLGAPGKWMCDLPGLGAQRLNARACVTL